MVRLIRRAIARLVARQDVRWRCPRCRMILRDRHRVWWHLVHHHGLPGWVADEEARQANRVVLPVRKGAVR